MDFDPTENSFKKIQHVNIKDNTYSKLVEHEDGHLYGVSKSNVVKINIETNEVIFMDHDLGDGYWNEWSDSLVGRDGCVYSLSHRDSRIVRHDPIEETTSVSDKKYDGDWGWWGMTLGVDGNGYCAPYKAAQILKILLPE